MHQNATHVLDPERVAHAFEHSITQEDDIWRADPADVPSVHANARQKFESALSAVTGGESKAAQGRILLFSGPSGVGKTHLIRALRTSAHRQGRAYFGYAQMSPNVTSYADYFLRRLIASLERPYDPDRGGETGLARLTRRFIEDVEEAEAAARLETLRTATLSDAALAELIHGLADRIIASPKYKGCGLDVNIVRALLYLERADPRIDQRVRSYLLGRTLAELSRGAVAALDLNIGENHAFDIIEALGKLMWRVDRAALVLCIDQIEDLRSFSDAKARFQRAAGDFIQITNRLPNAIVVLSCLDDFYRDAGRKLPESYIDRIEKAGKAVLAEVPTPGEARLIIATRLRHIVGEDTASADLDALLGNEFFEEYAGYLTTRKLLEQAEQRLRAKAAETALHDKPKSNFIDLLASALGGAIGDLPSSGTQPVSGETVAALPAAPHHDFGQLWDRHHNGHDAELPQDDAGLLTLLNRALLLAREESAGISRLDVREAGLAPDLPAFDMSLRHENGLEAETRVFLCNRATQGGGLKRQLDKVLDARRGRTCFLLRTSEFPQGRKNQTAEALNRLRDGGGRLLRVPFSDWERMMCVRDFHDAHRNAPGFTEWFAAARLLSPLPVVAQLLRLDLLSPEIFAPGTASGEAGAVQQPAAGADWPEQAAESDMAAGLEDGELPAEGVVAGRVAGKGPERGQPLVLESAVFKRHAAFLGGSGSGKTTLALSLIEQLLLSGIPAVLIDRKGDLASYANPGAWRTRPDESPARQAQRTQLAEMVDVAVYTPGRASGRPISITLLPNGIGELPEQEQQSLANLSAAALGDMLHLKTSATHQKQSGTLSVALRVLGARHSREVTLADLIAFLEDEDPELTDATQRMDPSGKIRRDLVAQLDSLRHRNTVLFEGGGEPLRMDALLGLGRHARKERTRLSIIYTGFLGDNENILFWVAQFLSEALRFCQRNPNDELQAVVMFDEADLYIPANAKPATAEPLQSLLKRARSAGLGVMLATQSPGDLDYRSRDQITSWFIGRVREDTALRKLKAAFQSESGLDPAAVLPNQTVGEFHLVQEGRVRPMKARRSLIGAEQVPFDRIEQLARRTKGQDESQLPLFGVA